MKHIDSAMLILSLVSPLSLAVLSLIATDYLADKYGDRSPVLIAPCICVGLAIYLAFIVSGWSHGMERQQKDMIEAMNKQQEVIVAQMNEIDAKHRAKASVECR